MLVFEKSSLFEDRDKGGTKDLDDSKEIISAKKRHGIKLREPKIFLAAL